MVFDEGSEGDGEELRSEKGVPETDAGRKKWFLTEANRKDWEFEARREHWCDFFNPYIDFNGTFPLVRSIEPRLLIYLVQISPSDSPASLSRS
jgi:Protein of unknown function (DUF1769)